MGGSVVDANATAVDAAAPVALSVVDYDAVIAATIVDDDTAAATDKGREDA